MVGLYGVMAYIASQRTTEIGIRMALGAQRVDMLRLILKQSLIPVGAGLAAGIIGALGATRVLAIFLYGVAATDLRHVFDGDVAPRVRGARGQLSARAPRDERGSDGGAAT